MCFPLVRHHFGSIAPSHLTRMNRHRVICWMTRIRFPINRHHRTAWKKSPTSPIRTHSRFNRLWVTSSITLCCSFSSRPEMKPNETQQPGNRCRPVWSRWKGNWQSSQNQSQREKLLSKCLIAPAMTRLQRSRQRRTRLNGSIRCASSVLKNWKLWRVGCRSGSSGFRSAKQLLLTKSQDCWLGSVIPRKLIAS